MRVWIISNLKDCRLQNIALNKKLRKRISYIFCVKDQFFIKLAFWMPKIFAKRILLKILKRIRIKEYVKKCF